MRNGIMGVAAAMMLEGLSAAAAMPDQQPEPGSAKDRPTGKTYPAGGGARERARRLAKMAKPSPYPQGADGRDIIPDENQF